MRGNVKHGVGKYQRRTRECWTMFYSADTAIRLGRYFGTDPRFWLNLQAAHDLYKGGEAAQLRESRAAHGGVIATLVSRARCSA